jgi:hypothetical protein
MTNGNLSRRKLLERGIQLPLGGLFLATAGVQVAAAAEKVCADLNAMDSGQKSIRESLNYVEMSKDPAKTCGGCGFFEAPKDGCGTCMIFTGGPANAKGHCDAFSAKG